MTKKNLSKCWNHVELPKKDDHSKWTRGCEQRRRIMAAKYCLAKMANTIQKYRKNTEHENRNVEQRTANGLKPRVEYGVTLRERF